MSGTSGAVLMMPMFDDLRILKTAEYVLVDKLA
jgi:hypothetical protein